MQDGGKQEREHFVGKPKRYIDPNGTDTIDQLKTPDEPVAVPQTTRVAHQVRSRDSLLYPSRKTPLTLL